MDPFLREVSHGVVRARWAQLTASVGSSPVVVARVGQMSRGTAKRRLADLRREYADMQAEERRVVVACRRLQVRVDAFRAAKEAVEAAYTAAEEAAEAAWAEVTSSAHADAEGAGSAAGQQN